MVENMKQSYKSNVFVTGFARTAEAQAIYDEAELKYGPAFAQYCVDALLGDEDSLPKAPPQNHHMNNLVRLTSQLNNLSQVCSADFFADWSAEDKLYYMTLLTAVSNDLSQALQGSLEEINADNTVLLKKQNGI